jgi:hypothetical protein
MIDLALSVLNFLKEEKISMNFQRVADLVLA